MQWSSMLLLLVLCGIVAVEAETNGVRRQLNPHSLMIEKEYLHMKQEERKKHKMDTNSTKTKPESAGSKTSKSYNSTSYESKGTSKSKTGGTASKGSSKGKGVTKKGESKGGKDGSKTTKCKKRESPRDSQGSKSGKRKGTKYSHESSNKYSKGKGAKGGSTNSTSTPKSKSGKGSKAASSKGSYDDDYYYDDECEESEMPFPTPTDVPVAPTPPPVPTTPPTGDDIVVQLAGYLLLYDIQQTRIPTLDDYAEVGEFTSSYLNQFFGITFGDVPNVVYVQSTSEVASSEFRLGQPVQVGYSTTVSFASSSTVIPEVSELDVLLAAAFEGTNGEGYTTLLIANLDASNIFATTSAVTFEQATQRSKSTFTGGFIPYAAGTVVAAAVVLAIYKRRKDNSIEYKETNLMDHMTAADDSYDDSHTYDLDEPVKKRYRNTRERVKEWGNANISVPRYNSRTFRVVAFEDDDSNSDDDSDDATLETIADSRKRLDEISF